MTVEGYDFEAYILKTQNDCDLGAKPTPQSRFVQSCSYLHALLPHHTFHTENDYVFLKTRKISNADIALV